MLAARVRSGTRTTDSASNVFKSHVGLRQHAAGSAATPPVTLTTTKATTYYSVHETTSKIFEEMVLRVPVHQGLHAGDVLAPVRDVLDAVRALGGLVGQRGRALVGRDSLLGEEVDADFFVDVYGPGVGRKKMVTERLDNILHS